MNRKVERQTEKNLEDGPRLENQHDTFPKHSAVIFLAQLGLVNRKQVEGIDNRAGSTPLLQWLSSTLTSSRLKLSTHPVTNSKIQNVSLTSQENL